MTATYNFKVDSFKIYKTGAPGGLLTEDPFNDGVPPPDASETPPPPPPLIPSYSTNGGLSETGGKLIFDSNNSPALLPALAGTGQTALNQQAIFNTNIDPNETSLGLKRHHEFAVEAIFDLTIPLENQQEYGVRFTDADGVNAADQIVGLAIHRGTDGRVWVELSEREVAIGTITVKGRIELTDALINGADQIKFFLSHDADSDFVVGSFELLTGGVSAGVVDVPGQAKVFDAATPAENFTRAAVYTTNFNIDEDRPTFVYELDTFRLEKNGNNILVDQFNDGVPPPSINNQGGGSIPGYNTFGQFSEAIEADGNGVLVMDSALAGAGSSGGMNLHAMNITAQTNTSNAEEDADKGLKKGDDFGAFARFNLILPQEERSEYGIRLTDTTGPGTGDDVIAVSVLKGVDGIVRVVLSERGLGANGYMEILGTVELTPALLGTADQIGLGLIHDVANPGVITARFRLYENNVELPGSPHSVPGFGKIFGTDTVTTSDDEMWTRAQVFSMGADDSDLILIEGIETDDPLTGTSAGETFFGHAGNDRVTGGGGIDTVHGGTGNDTVVLSGNVSDYTITAANNILTLVDNRGGSPDGTIHARGVENFEFADGTFSGPELLTSPGKYNYKVDSFKITRDGSVFLEDLFNDGIAPPNADGAAIKPPIASYLTSGTGLTEFDGRLVFDSNNAPQVLPAAGWVGQSAQQHQANFNSDIDPANLDAGLKLHHEFTAEAIFDLTLPLENQQEYGVRFIDGPSTTADAIGGLAVHRGTDGRLWVELTEREIGVFGTIKVKGRIELTDALIAGADQIKLTLSHDANSDFATGSFELLTAGVSAGEIEVGGQARIFNALEGNFTRAGVYTTNFNIEENRATFVYEMDGFRVEKNGADIMVDGFGNGIAPGNPNGGANGIGYATAGQFSEVIEGGPGGNGILVMDSALAFSGEVSGEGVRLMSATALTENTNATNGQGLKINDDFAIYGRFNLILPEEARSEYGIRFSDQTAPGVGDDIISVSVRMGTDGIVRVVLAERNFTNNTMEILGSIELTPELLGTADQIGLGLHHDADNPGVITAGIRLFENDVELPGGPYLLPGFGRIFGTDTATTADDEVWTRPQIFSTAFDLDGHAWIEGVETNDALVGTNADEHFHGHVGDDTITGGGGTDTIYGGSGTDKVILSGDVSDYTITADGTFFTLVDNRGGSPDGTIHARGVENFQFADTTLASSALLTPEIEVRGASNTEIVDGDTSPDGGDGTAFGNVNLGAAATQTFTINNLGGQPLTIGNFQAPNGFTIVTPPPGTIPGGESATFVIAVNTSTLGAKSGQITFTTNDSTGGENAYNFAVSANVVAAPTPEIAVAGLNGIDIKDNDTTPAANDGTDFGSSEINSAGTQRTFTVTNSGAAELNISNFVLTGGFTLVEGLDATIAIGASDTFTVELDTTAQGPTTGAISFTTNDPNESPFNFAIKGAVTANPEIEVFGNGVSITDNDNTPSAGDHTAFGDVLLGDTATRVFTINNTGTGTLTISNLKVPAGFTLLGSAPTSVAPGGSTTFEVQAISSAVGTKTGQITFTTNDPTGGENAYNFTISATVVPAPTPEIAVSGLNGLDIKDNDLAPATTDGTDFGSSEIFSAGTQRTFTVTNSGTADLDISNFLLSGGFTLVEGLDATIAIGGSDTFTVELDTTVQGPVTGAISFTTNDPNESPFNFGLKGNVTATPEVDVFGNATEIIDGDTTPDDADDTAFGTHVLGDDVVHTFTVENNGNGVMTPSQLKLPKGFVLVGPALPPTIPAGGSATFQVKLDTTKVGDFTGVISFKTNDTDESSYEFTVSGSVTQPEIDVLGNGQSIKDGSKKALITNHTLFDAGIGLDDVPAVRTFTISNAVGAADLTIDSATLVGTGFNLLTNLDDTVLQGGDSITFDVEIDTTIAGTRSAIIQIINNDANEALYDFVITGTVGPRNLVGNDAVDDVFVATIDPERFDGMTGDDTVSYANGAGPVVASLLTQTKNSGFALGDLYVSIENLIGSDFADTLTGNTLANVLEGGLGADKLDGGTGVDTASYENAGDAGGGVGVTADLLKATNNLGAAAIGDTYKNIENLLGSAFNDTLVGNTLNNAIDGGDGDDTLTGNGGIDTLTGGLGGDTFRFNAIKDGGGATKVLGVNPPPTGDLIVDFVSGEDQIGILRTGFKIAVGVDLGGVDALDFAAHYFVSAAGAAPTTANQSGVTATETGHGQFLFNETTDQLWWDPDGSGKAAATLLATFTNGAHILATDFDLI